MKTLFRRLSSTAALLAAVLTAPPLLATPTISFTPGQFPATGSPVALASTPAGLNISVNATPTGTSSIVGVNISVNGSVIGMATGSSPFVVNWVPTAAGTYTISATVTDTSTITTGASASTNTATINQVVTINAARLAIVLSPANNANFAQNAQIFLRATASMTDRVVSKVDFVLDPGTASETIIGTATQAPFNVPYTVTAAVGTHTILARATASDAVTTIDSATLSFNVSSSEGTAPLVSLSAPAAGTYLGVGQAVTVSATASDSDGFIPTAAGGGVTFYADGDPIGTDLTAPYSINWTPLVTKAYSLRALAIDDKGNQTLSGANTVNVVVMPTVAITAPTVGATTTLGSTVTVTASATASTGATVSQVAFFQNGVAIGAPVLAAPFTASFVPTSAGTVALTAQVTDTAGITVTSSTVNHTITAAQPTVAITAPAIGSTATVGSSVTVSATATPGTGATVAQVQFLAGSSIIGTVTSLPYRVTWTPNAAGNIALTAKVIDSNGATDTSSAVTVTVVTTPSVSLTAPANNSSATVGTAVTVTATAAASLGATVANVAFYANGVAIGAPVTSAPYSVAWTPSTAGATSLTAVVTDSVGFTATSAVVNVNVANSQPTVSLTAPTAGTVVTVGTSVTLAATASAGSGATITQVQFLVGGTTIVGTDTTAPYTLTWVPSSAGNFSLTARVTDTNNNTVTSTAVSITAAATTAVAITAPTTGSSATVGTAVNLVASATPTLGATISSVTFYATPPGGVATQIGATIAASPYTVSWTPAVAGAHVLSAVAVDSNGTSVNSSAVAVNVNNSAPTIALTTPLPGTVVTVGSGVSIVASAFAGSGATVTQVQFLAGTSVVATLSGDPSTSTYTTTWVPTTASNVSLTAKVTDSNGNSTTSSAVTVTAVAPAAPTIAITDPLIGAVVTAGSSVSITANATAAGSATVTQVQFLAGSTVIATLPGSSTTTTYTTTWVPASAANYSLTAKVTDSNGSTVTSSAITVTAVAAVGPTVSITAPALGTVVTIGNVVTLTATATAGAGASVAQVQFLSGGSTVLGTTTTAVGGVYSIFWTPTTASNFSITARVLDTAGNSATSSAITVTSTAATAVSLTAPANNSNAVVGTPVNLTASATPVAGAAITRVDFYEGATLLGSVFGAPYTLVWTPTVAGLSTLTAQAFDSNGTTVTSSAVTVNVTAAGPVSTVTLNAPVNGATLPVGSQLFLRATPALVGAITDKVDFILDGVSVGSVNRSPYNLPYTVPAAPGAHTLLARVTATDGFTTVDSATITLNFVAAVGAPPTVAITAPLAGAYVATGANVTVTATASDPDGFIPSGTGGGVTLFVDGDPVGTDTTAPYSITWNPGAAKTYSLRAQTADDKGNLVLSAPVTVTAVAALPTVALSSPPSSATVGTAVNLTANATPSTGASVTSVTFFANGVAIGAPITTYPYTISWTPATVGATALTAQVLDSAGITVTSATANVNVTGAAVSTVTLNAPANGATLVVDSQIFLRATPALVGAITDKVEFYLDGVLIPGASVTQVPYNVAWAVPALPGAHTLFARATATDGVTTVDSATIALNFVARVGTAPTVSLTAPLAGSTVAVSSNVALTATASDADGFIPTTTGGGVTFYVDGDPVGTDLTAPYSINWSPGTAKVYTIQAQAIDDRGNLVLSAPVSVTATVFTGPTAVITAPTVGSVVSLGTAVPISATVTPGLGGAAIQQVQFLAGGTILATLPGDPLVTVYTTSWTPTSAGNYSLTVRATDSNGSSSTSPAVSVTATAPSTTVVKLTSPAPNAFLQLNTNTTLTATVTLPTGVTATRYEFLVNDAVVVTTTTPSASWRPTTPGVFTLAVQVTDSTGAVAVSPEISVNVASSAAASVNLSMLPNTTSVPVNSSRLITASAVSSAGITSVDFYYWGIGGATLIGTDTLAPYNAAFTAPNEPGARVIRAVATDSSGRTIISSDLNINIVSQVGSAPVGGILTPISGAFLAVNSTTQITGTASDVDGSISNVLVLVNGSTSGVSNGGNANISGSTWSVNWTPSGGGVASITAIVTDNNGNAVAVPAVGVNITDSLSPNVTLSLSPRTSSAAASTTLPSGAVRNLVADATASSGRAIVRVEFFVDGTKVAEDTTVPYTHRYVAPALAEGEQSHPYVISVRATDNAGSARDAQLSVLVVSPVGAPPNVSLLTPANNASAVPGTTVTLAAAATSLDGTVASVQFYVNGSPASVNGGNAVTSTPFTASFTPTTPGSYTIDAIATDNRGNTTISNAATITAAYSVPTIVITAPNPNATARATPNVPLTLSATATVQTGAGASVLLVEFLLDGVQVAARTTPTNAALGTYATTWIPTTAQIGTHQLTARVTDNNSQTATSNPVNVTVANAVGTPPTVTISTTPIPGAGLQTLSQVNFIANAFANGVNTTISNVEFFLNDVSIGLASREQSTNLYRLAYDFTRIDFATAPVNPNNTSQYILPLYAIARDSNNNQTVSSTSNLTINAATSAAPTITLAALSQTTVSQGTQVFLMPTFSDSDGTVTQVQLYANGVVTQSIGSPTSGQSMFTYTPSTAGRYNLFAVATDETGNTAVSTPAIVLQVNAVNAPTTTITRPADNSTVSTVGAPIFLEGTARATGTTQVPTLVFIASGTSGSRQQITGSRVGTTTTYRAIWNPNTADTYSLITQATVAGVQSTSSASRNVVVNELIGLAPTISISVPSTVTTASSVNFSATVADSDGSVIGVEFFVNRNSIGQAVRDQLTNIWRLTASFAGLTPGSTEVVARATDSSGNVAASSTSFITLNAASSIAPSITVEPSTTNAAYNRRLQLRANARDTDGTVNSVQYYANGSSLGTSTDASSSYERNWTPTASGIYNVYAVATDNTNNIIVSPTVQVVVRRNNPILEDAAFILQTYQDIANTTSINPLVFDNLDTSLSQGTMARADLVLTLMKETTFQPPVNLLALYYVLMGQWPTPQNYTSLLSTARSNLTSAANSIINANEYFAKYGATPTTTLLNNPQSVLPAQMFLDRLWTNAGARPEVSRDLDLVRFMNNNTAYLTPTPPYGRGYNNAGLPTAVAEFVTFTNYYNTALFKRARAAALFYQLCRPAITVTVDEITARVNTLAALPDDRAIVEAVLRDVLYTYRYVTITKHPESLTVAARSGAIFTVEANGAPPLAYQWLLNGAPVAGATNAMLSLTNVSASNVGTYTVAITSSQATATSDPAILTLSSTPTRLANISTRGVTSGGSNVLIGGFIVTGTASQTRQMLVRVVGPTLANAPFNVPGVLANPSLELYAGNSRTPALTNDDWGTQAAGAAQVTAIRQATTRAGAFDLPNNSRDAAILATLPPGPYTVMATVPAATPNASGVVLIEVYDVTQGGPAGPKAANVSTRGLVGTGGNQLIAGFVVSGEVSRRLLIRGAGPTLSRLNVPGVLADPQITLVNQATGETLGSNDNWGSSEYAPIIATAATATGAFPFASDSRDAAMIIMLPPGAYTVQLTGVGNTTGVGIVEVYDVDP